MKASKKLLALFLSLAMVLALAACGGDSGTTTDEGTTTDDGTEATGLRICIISSTGVDDGSFNQNCYEGIQAFLADHPDCEVTTIEQPDYNQLIPDVESMVGDYDVFVLPGFNFTAVGDVAAANPDTKFIVVDSTITDGEGNPITLDNVYTMTFSEQEAGFFAGIAAAMETTTNKVAVVNGMPYPTNVNYQFGFMSGVNYANAHYGTSAECVELPSYAGTDISGNNVGGNYIGDAATGKVVGDALIAEGCDVLYVAAGNAGNGTFTAAKEADGVWLIGVDVDQYDDGAKGDSNIMLTSTLKVMDVNVQRQLEAIYDGTFTGQDAYLDTKTDSVGYVSEEGRQQLSEDTLAALAEVYELVKDGTIVPAADSTVNDYTPDNFPGL